MLDLGIFAIDLEIALVILLGTGLLAFVITGWALIHKVRKKYFPEYPSFYRWVLWYLAASFAINSLYFIERFNIFRDFIELSNIVTLPFSIIINTIPVIAGVWIATKINKNSKKESLTSDESIHETVQSIFNSNEFYTAINTVLPKGEKDAELGLDYIPYMLQNVETRRQLYKKRAAQFLTINFVLGAAFSIIIVFFSFILINEDAAGLPKAVAELESTLSKLNTTSARLSKEYDKSDQFHNEIGFTVQQFVELESSGDEVNFKKNLQNDIRVLLERRAFTEIEKRLQGILLERVTIQNLDNDYLSTLQNTKRQVSKYLASINAAVPKLNSLMLDATENVKLVATSISDSEFRRVELLKRLGLGLIVSTFFLALLRYVAGLYKVNHNEMLQAEREDMRIRQFYVAFKGMHNNEGGKKDLMLTFFNDSRVDQAKSQKATSGLNNEEVGLIKELLDTFKKKI